MKNDLLLLTLLYAVAFSAFIGAINSRGPVRVALSYFLAILTLCAAVFHTSQYLAGGSLGARSDEAVVVTPPPFPTPAVPAQVPAAPVTPPPADTAAIAASKTQVVNGEAKNDLKGVLDIARRISRSLSALNLGTVADVSDEEYEALQNKTVGFLTEARRAKEKLGPIAAKAPEPLKAATNDLSQGIDALVTAAYNAERFFKSENDTEEKAHLGAFRHGSQTANALFKKAGTELGSEDAGE